MKFRSISRLKQKPGFCVLLGLLNQELLTVTILHQNLKHLVLDWFQQTALI